MRFSEQLKRVAFITTGSTPPTNEPRYYESEEIDWFTPGDIGDASIMCKAGKMIANCFFEETGSQMFPANSVLMVGIGATVGKVGYVEQRCYANQQINAISFNKQKVLPKYGAYWMLDKKEEVNRTTPSVTLPICNQSKVRLMEIIYPALSEQQKIVDYLDAKSAAIDLQVTQLEKKRELYERLKTATINRAVTRGLNENVRLKDSGVDWMGRIPEHWNHCRIKDLCTYVSRGATPDYVEESDYKVMNQAVFSKGYVDYEIVRYSAQMKEDAHIKKGDLLIASTGGGVLGKVLYYDEDDKGFYADTHVTILRNSRKTFSMKFLYYCMVTKFDMINAYMALGSTNQTELQRDKLINHHIPCPPLSEQQAIASYLDKQCIKIDAAIYLIEKQVAALKRLKRALVHEVITSQRALT